MWHRADSQEVGLEAAILERVRNSSLVEWRRAENVTGLKPPTEAAAVFAGRAFALAATGKHGVGERSGIAEKPPRERAVERTEVRMPE